jgi:hypothetical protein
MLEAKLSAVFGARGTICGQPQMFDKWRSLQCAVQRAVPPSMHWLPRGEEEAGYDQYNATRGSSSR